MTVATYRVTETDTGREISPGDTVTNFRGETGTFQRVTRGTGYNGTAKVLVRTAKVLVHKAGHDRENYERVWGLTVETIKE